MDFKLEVLKYFVAMHQYNSQSFYFPKTGTHWETFINGAESILFRKPAYVFLGWLCSKVPVEPSAYLGLGLQFGDINC